MSWTRRALLVAGVGQTLSACALGGGPKIIGGVRMNERALSQVVARDAVVEEIARGFTWTEGPVWVDSYDGGYLLFSDVPANVVHRWSPNGGVEEFLNPSGFAGADATALREPGANGLCRGRPGELLMCDSGNRAVVSLDLISKRRATLADRYGDRRLNSPNDLVLSRSGAIYFTDPPYGLADLNDSPIKELDFNGVFRLAPDGRVDLVDDTLTFPNGIALSPDESRLYVSNSDRDQPILRVYELDAKGFPTRSSTFFDASKLMGRRARGLPDGMAVDSAGRVFASGPGGVLVLSPEGRLLGRIEVDQTVANCAFGEDGRTLFLAADDSIARIRLRTSGPA